MKRIKTGGGVVAKRYEIEMTLVLDLPWISQGDIVAAITADLNARGIFLESASIAEVKA